MSDNGAIWVHVSHHDGGSTRWRSSCSARRTSWPSRPASRWRRSWSATRSSRSPRSCRTRARRRIRVVGPPVARGVLHGDRTRRRRPTPRARHRPQTLLLGADNENAALAARVAARLGTGLSAHCVDLKLERGLLVQTVPGFGGQLMANIVCPRQRPQMATVVAGVFSPVTTDTAAAEVVREEMASLGGAHGARGRAPAAPGRRRRAARHGRGGGRRRVRRRVEGALVRCVEELAALLHGEVGATRPPVDEGWARPEQMIGASGAFVVAVAVRRRRHLRHDAPRRRHPRREDHRRHQQRPEGAHLLDGRLRHRRRPSRGAARAHPPDLRTGEGLRASHSEPPETPRRPRSSRPACGS